MAEKHHEQHDVHVDNAEMAPDPDEDDLSDLDDVLDEFSATKIADSKPPPSAAPATAAPTSSTQAAFSEGDGDDFAKQLQAGMADLLGELDSDPEMQKQFEAMMKELGVAAAAEAEAAPATNSQIKADKGQASASAPVATDSSQEKKPQSTKKPAEESFQDTIRRTMERMQNSGETASAAAASASEDDLLAQMLKEMESGGFPGGNEDDFNSMLLGMMEQLTNKEILYDPMKELHDKFPAWLQENRDKVPKEDITRYEEQQRVVSEIVARFERKEYSDESKADREYIVERMQQMQAAGSPPPDLVGDMSAAQEALGGLDQGCPQQ